MDINNSGGNTQFRGNSAHTGEYFGPDIFNEKANWAFTTNTGIASSPTVWNNYVYFGSVDHSIYALNTLNGTEKWRFDIGDVILSSPTVINGIVYIGSNDHNIYALDALTGSGKWRFVTEDTVRSSPAIFNGILYAGSDDNNIYALDALNGEEKWRFKTYGNVSSSPAISNGIVYVGSEDYNLYALDALTGKEKWRFKADNAIISSPAVSDGIVYVGSEDYNLYALDALTGKEKWRFKTDTAIDSSPAISNGIVYVGSGDYNLYALDALTGKEKWRFKTNNIIFSSPAVSSGRVYFGSDKLYAISTDNPPDKSSELTTLSSTLVNRNKPSTKQVVSSEEYEKDIDVHPDSSVPDKRLKWRFHTGMNGYYINSPAVSNNVVFVQGREHFYPQPDTIHALDALTGLEKWRFETDGPVSSPVSSNGVVYIISGNGNITALEALTGTKMWGVGSNKTTSHIEPPVIADGLLYYAGIDDNFLYALDTLTGKEKWRFEVEDRVYHIVVSKSVVFIDDIRSIYALNAQTGDLIWTIDDNNFLSGRTVCDDVMYISITKFDKEYLYALDTIAPVVKWKADVSSNINPPVVSDGLIYIGSYDGNITAMDTQTGKEEWKFRAGDKDVSPISVLKDVIYVGGDNNNLYALDALTGREKWRYKTDKGISSIMASNGVVYIGCYDGYMYALDSTDSI